MQRLRTRQLGFFTEASAEPRNPSATSPPQNILCGGSILAGRDQPVNAIRSGTRVRRAKMIAPKVVDGWS